MLYRSLAALCFNCNIASSTDLSRCRYQLPAGLDFKERLQPQTRAIGGGGGLLRLLKGQPHCRLDYILQSGKLNQ
jgi:hypothetical protein